MTLSAKTSANMTQEIIQNKLEKRSRLILGPLAGKQCCVFIDDINMPLIDKYGS